MSKKVIIENFGEIEYDAENHILYTRVRENAAIDEKIAKNFVDKSHELTGNDKFGTVSDLRKMVFVGSAGRKVFAKYRSENLICVGSVINSTLQRGFINLFLKYSNPNYEIKFFTDYEKAKEWVKSKVAEYYRLNL